MIMWVGAYICWLIIQVLNFFLDKKLSWLILLVTILTLVLKFNLLAKSTAGIILLYPSSNEITISSEGSIDLMLKSRFLYCVIEIS